MATPKTFLYDISQAARDEWSVQSRVYPIGGRGKYKATHQYSPTHQGVYQIFGATPAEWKGLQSGTSLEQQIYAIASQAGRYPSAINPLRRTQGGYMTGDEPSHYLPRVDVYQTEQQLQALLSWAVADAMGYRPGEGGVYGWGELGAIYQGTPTATVAKQIEKWRSAGQTARANLAELFYSSTRRAPETGTSQSGKYPLRGPSGGLAVLYPQMRTGQRDVRLDPALVARLTTERPTERARKRRYKGGTRVAGALSTLELGKRKLGE